MAVLYGQNFLVMGSIERINFYFIGMALSGFLFSLVIFLAFKNIATSFYLFMCVGTLFNEVVYAGNVDYIEIILGLVGVLYILIENKIKWR